MTEFMYAMKKHKGVILFFCGLVLAALLPLSVTAAPGDIVTIAGGGAGDGGPATAAITAPNNVALDSAGNVYIADCTLHRVRKVDSTGIITTVAGIGGPAYSGDGGPATAAGLSCPSGVFVDNAGNILIADSSNNRIRKIDAAGIITTIAGNGTAGYSGDGGAATEARLNGARHLVGDASGNIIIADTRNHSIRKVNVSGVITTIAGTGTAGYSGDGGSATATRLYSPAGVAMDTAGNVYIADQNNQRIRKVNASGIITTVAGNGTADFSGDGGPAASANLKTPGGVFIDASGTMYIADTGNNRIRKVTTSGIINTVAGKGTYGAYSGDGGAAVDASLNCPTGVVVNAGGNVYLADSMNLRVRVINSAGIINTMAGDGVSNYYGDEGSAVLAGLGSPSGIAMDGAGNLYIADHASNRVRRVDVSGVITTVAGNGTGAFSGDNGPGRSAGLSSPQGVAVDPAGNLYIADVFNARIRKVDTSGLITTYAGNGSFGYSGDGGLATQASLNYAFGIATDGIGNLYIADRNNNRLRKVDALGVITTIAGNGTAAYSGDGGPATSASLNAPIGVATDAEGNIYLSDGGNQRIRKITPSGTIITVAGNGTAGFSGDDGPALSASLNGPDALFVDAAGQVYVADSSNQRIRKIDTAGTITTVAGNGSKGFYGDGASAISGSLNYPAGIAGDAGKNLYIADSQNMRVRKVLGARDNYLISATSGTGGSISPADSVTVIAGASQTFTITPDRGYHVADVTVDGTSVGPVSSYTFTSVMENHSIAAIFAISSYGVTPSAGANGSISPATPQAVNYNQITSFTITPNSGYHVDLVSGCTGTLNGNTYTTGPITQDCTVSATFAVNTYTVTPSAGANGSINPTTPQTINYNQTATFTVTPNPGYHIDLVSGCTGTLNGNTYTTAPVTSNCAVSATFAQNQYTLTVTKAGTGSGAVSSSPSGISCGATCSSSLASGASVTLTALPGTGSFFAGWSGSGCSGTGTCVMTMDAAKAVTATFNPISITVTTPNGGESWSRGSTYTIRWNYAGDPGANVKIDLLKNGSLNRTITRSTFKGSNGSGSYSWTIPSNQTRASDYAIRITSTSNSSYKDASNATFGIR